MTRELLAKWAAPCLLEVGCGPGRLPIGLIDRRANLFSYAGVDVDWAAIDWCRRHIRNKRYRFIHIDVANPRYNATGANHGQTRLPLLDDSLNAVYLYSVFSHLLHADVQSYLLEFRRLLVPSGRVFLTAFVEHGVPDCEENPSGYIREWRGPLHCVRYSWAFFESMLDEAGFRVDRIESGVETDGQSAFYLTRA